MNEFEAITHIHTDASNGDASALDPMIMEAFDYAFGPAADLHRNDFSWKECFNTPQEVCEALRPGGPVSLVFLTDHVNERYHRISEEALKLASRDPRVAVGAEIQTWTRDSAGKILRAPELLVYGKPGMSFQGGIGFFGVTNEDLDALFMECQIDSSGKADIMLARDFCLRRGYAHALAHPFDGSDLGLEQLLEIIPGFKFVETLNGGFPADSAERLSILVSWYNKAAEDLVREDEIRSDLLRRLHAAALERGPVHPWGGSDAHAHNHDRVVILYRTGRESPATGDFLSDMVGWGVRDLIARRTFSISGAAATPISLLDDVARITCRNILDHISIFRENPRLWEIIAKIRKVTAAELMRRRRRRKQLTREFDEKVGGEIRLHLAGILKERWRRSFEEAPIPPSLPERIP